jgi:hypothetical protein
MSTVIIGALCFLAGGTLGFLGCALCVAAGRE